MYYFCGDGIYFTILGKILLMYYFCGDGRCAYVLLLMYSLW